MREPSTIQRLMREKALGRYLTALERGDIDTIISSLERAENDPVLERMILEVHESYQTEEEFQAMFQEEQKENIMEIEDGIHKSKLRTKTTDAETEREPQPVYRRQPGKSTRWLQLLAAALLIVCLAGSVFMYARLRQSTQVASAPKTGYNWCTMPVASLNTGGGQFVIDKLVTISANDAWLTGEIDKNTTSPNTEQTSPITEHWNGTKWQVVPTADTTALLASVRSQVTGAANEDTLFSDIKAVAPDDIWVIGSINIWQNHLGGPQSPGVSQGLIEHWNGSVWQLVNYPDVPTNNDLSSIGVVSANDVWAVGGDISDNQNYIPLITHWDGTNWQKVELPDSLQHGYLQKIQVNAANDVWVFGVSSEISSATPVALHWDGYNWSTIDFPDGFFVGESINDALAISSSNIWLVGSTFGVQVPFIQHWDGYQWSRVAGGRGIDSQSSLYGIFANGANNIWIAGTTANNTPLLEHWDGQNWSRVQSKGPPFGAIRGVAFAGDTIWLFTNIYKDSSGFPPIGSLLQFSC